MSDYFSVCFGKSFERIVWVQLMYIILTYRLILLLQKMIIHALEWCMDCIVAALYWILWNVCKWMLINAVIISVVLAVKYIWTQGSPNPTKAKQPKQRENKHANEGANTPDTHTHEAAGLSPNKRTGTEELST